VKNPSFFFELSGEHPEMALEEALSCITMFAGDLEEYHCGPGFLLAEFPSEFLPRIASRIALTHRIGLFMGHIENLDDMGGVNSSSVPAGSFSIRVKRFESAQREVSSQTIIRNLGKVLSADRKVDLSNPDHEIRVFISTDISVHHSLITIDRQSLEDRKVAERPFFSPISLHPRYARALINILQVKEGQTLLDPFCGTGGILLEAAAMGIKALASDISEEMIQGTKQNMDHFELCLSGYAVADISDIAFIFPDTDAIVTDPPYGRSASTNGEETGPLYIRTLEAAVGCLREGGRLGIVVPLPLKPIEGLVLEHLFQQKVHGSLSRFYHVFKKQ